MKSVIEKKKDLEEGKEFVVEINPADPIWDIRRKQLIEALPGNTTKDEIIQRVNNMMIRESCFNVAMDHLSKVFAFKIAESELKEQKELIGAQMRPQFEAMKSQGADITEEMYEKRLNEMATKTIMKELIYGEIAKIKNITISDEEVKKSIKEFGSATKTDTASLEGEEEFKAVKQLVLENKIVDAILNMYKFGPANKPEEKA